MYSNYLPNFVEKYVKELVTQNKHLMIKSCGITIANYRLIIIFQLNSCPKIKVIISCSEIMSSPTVLKPSSIYARHEQTIVHMLTYPSMIMASSAVSPFSSGLPPKPTVPSHCSRSHVPQPATTASTALPPRAVNSFQAEIHAHHVGWMFVRIFVRTDDTVVGLVVPFTFLVGWPKVPCVDHQRNGRLTAGGAPRSQTDNYRY